MSAPPPPPEPAKQLLPFLQRADELQKHDLLVAYFCRLYAMELGLKIPVKERTKATNALLLSLMNQLEKDKKIVKLSPEDGLYMEGFALSVFSKADKQDRTGRADLNTAKTFYAASIFFDVLHQFGDLQPDIEQKAKYSVWKAADIRKALGEGRRPTPGPPGGDQDFCVTGLDWESEVSPVKDSRSDYHRPFDVQDTTSPSSLENRDEHVSQLSTYTSQSSNLLDPHQGVPQPPHIRLSSSADFPSTSQPAYSVSFTADEQGAAPLHVPTFHLSAAAGLDPPFDTGPQSSFYPVTTIDASSLMDTTRALPSSQNGSYNESAGHHQASSSPAGYGSYGTRLPVNPEVPYQPSPEKVAEAHKAARYAVSALAFDDVSTAVSFLRTSLELLTSPSATIQ